MERFVFSSLLPSNKNKRYPLELRSSRGVNQAKLKPLLSSGSINDRVDLSFFELDQLGLSYLCLAEMKLPPEIRSILLPNCQCLAIFQ